MRILIFIFCASILLACKKPRTIKIIAKNTVTGVPYAGLSYKVVSSRTTANGEKYQTEAEGVLNENGEAIEEIKVKTGRSYSVRIGKLDNICYHNELHQYFESPYDVDGTFTFNFAECAYLKHKFNNINCFDEYDTLKLRILNLKNYFSNLEFQYFIGCQNFDSGDFSQVPFGEVRYYWEVVKNGNTNIFYDTIFLAPNEERTYEINY